MLPTDKEIQDADIVTAVMGDDSDLLTVFRNPDFNPVVREGEAYGTANHVFAHCNNADELFALRAKVRELRGDEGMYSKEERRETLMRLYETDCAAFASLHAKRTNLRLDPKEITPFLAARMIGDFMEREHAGE